MYVILSTFFEPSDVETFGNVTLEALSSGCPCVVEKKCGEHLVEHLVNGLTCAAGNFEEFYQATRRLVVDHQLRAQMSSSARRSARKFERNIILQQMAENYKVRDTYYYYYYYYYYYHHYYHHHHYYLSPWALLSCRLLPPASPPIVLLVSPGNPGSVPVCLGLLLNQARIKGLPWVACGPVGVCAANRCIRVLMAVATLHRLAAQTPTGPKATQVGSYYPVLVEEQDEAYRDGSRIAWGHEEDDEG